MICAGAADMRLFNAEIARTYGLEEAVFHNYLLDQLWSAYSLKATKQSAGDEMELVIIEGQPWIPKTLKEIGKELPFWTEKQIRRIITSCKRQGLISTDSYYPNQFGQRLWYALEGVTVDAWR